MNQRYLWFVWVDDKYGQIQCLLDPLALIPAKLMKWKIISVIKAQFIKI